MPSPIILKRGRNASGSQPGGGHSALPKRYLLELDITAVDDNGEEHITFATSMNAVAAEQVDGYIGKTVTVLWHPAMRNKALFAE